MILVSERAQEFEKNMSTIEQLSFHGSNSSRRNFLDAHRLE